MSRSWWRGVLLAVFVAIVGAGAGGCASRPATTVILLPDEDGHVGAVIVSSEHGTRRVDQAYAQVTVDAGKSAPTAMQALGRTPVESAYGRLLKAQPGKPKSFVLNFMLDSTTLTEESRARLPEVLRTVRERKPTEITVFGHADAMGSEHRNLKLSAERARVVADLLKKDDPGLPVEVQYFGDKAPLYPSERGQPEPRNRRAEVVIL